MTKNLISVLDPAPVLDEQLIRLGQWIADYYLAPVGEVFRTMLPLGAEFKRAIAYRITEEGQMALHLAGMSGSSARSQKTPEDQLAEFRVLDYLAERETTREESLRAATRASKALLAGMVRKKWIAREDLSEARDAVRTVKVCDVENRGGQTQRQPANADRYSGRGRRKSAGGCPSVAGSSAHYLEHAGEARRGGDCRRGGRASPSPG